MMPRRQTSATGKLLKHNQRILRSLRNQSRPLTPIIPPGSMAVLTWKTRVPPHQVGNLVDKPVAVVAEEEQELGVMGFNLDEATGEM
jgi:hypothetical protein